MAAMEIGRVIRSLEGTAIVGPHDECSSACVFVLASGASRGVLGRVGIHRPYLDYTPDDQPIDIEATLNRLDEAMTAYLQDMDIPLSLLDAMRSERPETLRYLSEAELTHFLLNQSDPLHDEVQAAQMAKHYGIATAEYRRRAAEGIERCLSSLQMTSSRREIAAATDCYDRILRGE